MGDTMAPVMIATAGSRTTSMVLSFEVVFEETKSQYLLLAKRNDVSHNINVGIELGPEPSAGLRMRCTGREKYND